jgi:hypothetical protein
MQIKTFIAFESDNIGRFQPSRRTASKVFSKTLSLIEATHNRQLRAAVLVLNVFGEFLVIP